jgi:segregation and condensation protein B
MQELKSKIESLLFVSAKPLSIKALASAASVDEKEAGLAGDELSAELKAAHRGLQIIRNKDSFQMVSSPENTELIQSFIKDETTGELSRPSLETLTIIAYRGPISKSDIDRLRGVNCSMILRNLLLRGLIEIEEDKAKEQTYYQVSLDFVRFLGLTDVRELPDYEQLSNHESLAEVLKKAEESV